MSTYHFTAKSRNVKTGPIPVTVSSGNTCPDACPFLKAGCYAANGPLAMHWRQVSDGTRGDSLAALCDNIAALPAGQLWRHNAAGDLPGNGDAIDGDALRRLSDANAGKRGFTYTHKPPAHGDNAAYIAAANAAGFTINLSGNNLAHADALADMAIGPVVVVQDAPNGTRADTVTPAGRKVVTCPATYRDNVNCASCGLCAVRNRKVIVGFPAHGVQRKAAAKIAQGE
jgi:hypothetical protein